MIATNARPTQMHTSVISMTSMESVVLQIQTTPFVNRYQMKKEGNAQTLSRLIFIMDSVWTRKLLDALAMDK